LYLFSGRASVPAGHPDDVGEFASTLRSNPPQAKALFLAGVDCRRIGHPIARHGFSNPEADAQWVKFHLNIGYGADADRLSRQALQRFLKEVFRQPRNER